MGEADDAPSVHEAEQASHGDDRHSDEWHESVARLPSLPPLTGEEWNALFEGAEPPTEDDVPWRFPVRTPLEEDRRR